MAIMKKLTTIIIQNNHNINHQDVELLVNKVSLFSNNTYVLSNQQDTKYVYCPTPNDFIKQCNIIAKNIVENLLILSSSDFNTEYLEELNSILLLTDRHGAVSPRGSNMGILTIPIQEANIFQEDVNKSSQIYDTIKNILPRYHIAPYLSSMCILIKGNLIRCFGFLNENDKDINSAIINFSLKISNYGFSSIVANKIFLKNTYFIENNNKSHINILNKYINENVSIYDKFAKVLYKDNIKPKILISLHHLTATYNGSSIYGLNLLEKLVANFSTKYEFHILATKEVATFFNLQKYNCKIIYQNTISDFYHIGITFSHIYDPKLAIILNKYCLKIIQTVLDLIFYRCRYYSINVNPFVFENMIKYSNIIISISEFVKNDILTAFPNLSNKLEIYHIPPALPIYNNINKTINHKLPFKNYILVLGNSYPHKAIKDIIDKLSNINQNFVVIGYKIKSKIKNIVFYESGALQESYIDLLYKNCTCLIFPSQYEGFGLPIIQALQYNKKVIVTNNEINKELSQLYTDFKDNFIFFDNFDEISDLIKNISFNQENIKHIKYTFNDVAIKTEEIITMALNNDIDFYKLEERDIMITSMNIYPQINSIIDKINQFKDKFPSLYKNIKRIYIYIKKVFKKS